MYIVLFRTLPNLVTPQKGKLSNIVPKKIDSLISDLKNFGEKIGYQKN